MDLGEHLFRKVLRFKTKLGEKEKSQLNEKQATLEQMRERLFSLAAMLSAKRFEIVGGIGHETVSNSALLFPDSISVLDKREENEMIYIYRLIFLLEAHEQGIRSSKTLTPLQSTLSNLLVARKLGCDLCARYPGARPLQETVYRKILQQRQSIQKIQSASDILEFVLRNVLDLSNKSRTGSMQAFDKLIEDIISAGNLSAIDEFEKRLISAKAQKGIFDDPKIFALPSDYGTSISESVGDQYESKQFKPPKVITQLERTIHIMEAKKSKAFIS